MRGSSPYTSDRDAYVYIPINATHTHSPSMADNYHTPNISGASEDSFLPACGGYNHEPGGFEASDFLQMDDWLDSFPADFSSLSHILNSTPNELEVDSSRARNGGFSEEAMINYRESGEREKKGIREKVAFKTKSEIEILDDGFKWRKYGKKMVKNSPNPRNYYKCSVERCPVKKRVERDKEDRRYVVTTYEGIHNHEGPTR